MSEQSVGTTPIRHARPDMSACHGCAHFREKDRSGTHLRRMQAGRPASDWRQECCWFWAPEGRRASPDERMTMLVVSSGGGQGCQRRVEGA